MNIDELKNKYIKKRIDLYGNSIQEVKNRGWRLFNVPYNYPWFDDLNLEHNTEDVDTYLTPPKGLPYHQGLVQGVKIDFSNQELIKLNKGEEVVKTFMLVSYIKTSHLANKATWYSTPAYKTLIQKIDKQLYLYLNDAGRTMSRLDKKNHVFLIDFVSYKFSTTKKIEQICYRDYDDTFETINYNVGSYFSNNNEYYINVAWVLYESPAQIICLLELNEPLKQLEDFDNLHKILEDDIVPDIMSFTYNPTNKNNKTIRKEQLFTQQVTEKLEQIETMLIGDVDVRKGKKDDTIWIDGADKASILNDKQIMCQTIYSDSQKRISEIKDTLNCVYLKNSEDIRGYGPLTVYSNNEKLQKVVGVNYVIKK